jgi:hypothetical protein
MKDLIHELFKSKVYIITFLFSIALILLSLLDQIPTGKIVSRTTFDFSSITLLVLGGMLLLVSGYLLYFFEVKLKKQDQEDVETKKEKDAVKLKKPNINSVIQIVQDPDEILSEQDEAEINSINKIFVALSHTQQLILKNIYHEDTLEILEKNLYKSFKTKYRGYVKNEDEFHYRLKNLMCQNIKFIEVCSIGKKTSNILKFHEIRNLLIKAKIIKTDSP